VGQYVIRFRTEPCEIPGVLFVTEIDANGNESMYCAQSSPGGGESDAVAAFFEIMASTMRVASASQVKDDLSRWEIGSRSMSLTMPDNREEE
jgi:hypothetical protein